MMGFTVTDLHKKYGDKVVVDHLSFRMDQPGVYALLGTNGAGKTTSIRMILNMLSRDSGTVEWNGGPLTLDTCNVGYLAEERGLYPKNTLMDQLMYFASLRGVPRADAKKRLSYWAERLEATEYLFPPAVNGRKPKPKKADQLSKGNQQKIQLITAVAHDPDLIVLDEPFSGLDPVNAGLLKSVVEEEIEKGKIVLFSSHQMNYIEEFCDHIAILNRGSLVLEGSLREIKRSYPRTTLTVTSPEIGRIAAAFGGEPQGDALTLRLRDEAEKRSVMQKLAADYEIDGVSVFEPSLADIFVEYAGDAC